MPGAIDLTVSREGFDGGIITLYARDEEEVEALKRFRRRRGMEADNSPVLPASQCPASAPVLAN